MTHTSPPPPGKPPNLERNRFVLTFTLAVFAITAGFVLRSVFPDPPQLLAAQVSNRYTLPQDGYTPPSPPEQTQFLKTFSKVFVNMAKQTRPSLVYIETQSKASAPEQLGPPGFFPFFPFPFNGDGVQEGAGSGFIVDLGRGYVVTNAHVATGAQNILVTTFDDRKFKARVRGVDEAVDVAVLQLENFSPRNLRQVGFADSSGVEVGDWVVALGAPFGLPQTLTVGVVSAVGRGNVVGGTALEDFIQTDAAINPGNSGGPLLNIEGRVVGMNTAISSPTGAFAGIGFAVPSNMIKSVSEMLINEGKVTRGYLGFSGQDLRDLSNEVLTDLNLKETDIGALVVSVVPGSPAEKAGLKASDLITAYNQAPVHSFTELRNRVAFSKPGSDVTLSIKRGNQTLDLRMKVGKAPERPPLRPQRRRGTG